MKDPPDEESLDLRETHEGTDEVEWERWRSLAFEGMDRKGIKVLGQKRVERGLMLVFAIDESLKAAADVADICERRRRRERQDKERKNGILLQAEGFGVGFFCERNRDGVSITEIH